MASFLSQHNAFLSKIVKAQPPLVFVGDSITANWLVFAPSVWNADYAPRHAFDLGLSGDFTQGVLWRIANHELDGINPKAVVLLIGTNDISAGWSAPDIAHGIIACVSAIRAKQPTANILLLAVLPRGLTTGDPNRVKAAAIDAILAGTSFGPLVTYLDMSHAFVQSNGSLMPGFYLNDALHPVLPGYRAWAAAEDPILHTFGL